MTSVRIYRRRRSVVLADLAASEIRLDALRRELETLNPDSDEAHEHAWHARRIASCRAELGGAPAPRAEPRPQKTARP
jgi:hypothetical protein